MINQVQHCIIQQKRKTKSAALFISALGYYSSINFTKDKKLASFCDCRPPNIPMPMITLPVCLEYIYIDTRFLGILKIVCLEDMNKYFDVLPICY